MIKKKSGTDSRTRTDTPLLARDFESLVYTNFTISALLLELYLKVIKVDLIKS